MRDCDALTWSVVVKDQVREVRIWATSAGGNVATPIAGIPTAIALDTSTPATDGTYDHTIVARKGSRSAVVDYTANAAGPVPLVTTVAAQQSVTRCLARIMAGSDSPVLALCRRAASAVA